jgi:hypothetical protein
MILGGTSKSNKSWCLLDLALSVASGQPWWGRLRQAAGGLYQFRAASVGAVRNASMRCARPGRIARDMGENPASLESARAQCRHHLLRPKLEEQLEKHPFGLIILDPAYKVLGNRDENANGEIASLMNELEAMAQKTGAAVVVAHHFAKGDSTAKNAMDRMSGAGAWARDPDSIMVLTPHEEPDCFTVTSILRNLPQLPEFVLAWDYPLMRLANDLNPDALRRPQAKNKVCSDKEFMDAVLGTETKNYKGVINQARQVLEMSEALNNNPGRATRRLRLSKPTWTWGRTGHWCASWRAKSWVAARADGMVEPEI